MAPVAATKTNIQLAGSGMEFDTLPAPRIDPPAVRPKLMRQVA
jgi:hypothetical protein